MFSLVQCPPGYIVVARDGVNPEPQSYVVEILGVVAQQAIPNGPVQFILIPFCYDGQTLRVMQGELRKAD